MVKTTFEKTNIPFILDFFVLIIYFFKKSSDFAPVAQGIERQPPELKAAGSNPAGRTK